MLLKERSRKEQHQPHLEVYQNVTSWAWSPTCYIRISGSGVQDLYFNKLARCFGDRLVQAQLPWSLRPSVNMMCLNVSPHRDNELPEDRACHTAWPSWYHRSWMQARWALLRCTWVGPGVLLKYSDSVKNFLHVTRRINPPVAAYLFYLSVYLFWIWYLWWEKRKMFYLI